MPASRLRERPPIQLALANEVVSVRVRESSRARTARILVGPRHPLEVIVPARTGDAAVRALLGEKRQWIIDKLSAARETAARPAVLGLNQPGVVYLAGRVIPVNRRSDLPPGAVLRTDVVIVGGDDDQAAPAIERWYRRQTAGTAKRLVSEHAPRLGVVPNSVAIRDPSTRWGSCSKLGNLSFSWRLTLAPTYVFEYVVVHELCHLIEPNHSRAFWRLLDNVYPDWRDSVAWLRDHGQELHDYRPRINLELTD